jgi:hypothetical protein
MESVPNSPEIPQDEHIGEAVSLVGRGNHDHTARPVLMTKRSSRESPLATYLLVALLTVLVGFVSAVETGSIQGRVVAHRTHQPIVGAAVEVVGAELGTNTDENGYYTIQGVPTGQRTVKAYAIGYEAMESADLTLLPGRSVRADFEMYAKALKITDGGNRKWTGCVTFSVVDSLSGKSISGFLLVLDDSANYTQRSVGLNRFPAGDYLVTPDNPLYFAKSISIHVAQGCTTQIQIRLAPIWSDEFGLTGEGEYTGDSRHDDSLRKLVFATYRHRNGRYVIRRSTSAIEWGPVITYLVVDRDSCRLIVDPNYGPRDYKPSVSRVSRIELFRFGYDPELKLRIEEPATENSPNLPGFQLKLIFPDGKSDWF